MTIIYLTEHKTKCYGVTFGNNGYLGVRKFEDISAVENNKYYVKPLEVFVGKSQVCDLTIFSGALDNSVFDGNTILLKISKKK